MFGDDFKMHGDDFKMHGDDFKMHGDDWKMFDDLKCSMHLATTGRDDGALSDDTARRRRTQRRHGEDDGALSDDTARTAVHPATTRRRENDGEDDIRNLNIMTRT